MECSMHGRHQWEDDNEMWEVLDWIYVAEDRDQY